MTILTKTSITRKDGSPGAVVKPGEPTAVMSLYPLKVTTIMWGVLLGNIVAGIVGLILYGTMQ